MDFLRNNLWLVVLIVLVIVYFVFKAKIDKWLGLAKEAINPQAYSCRSTFYMKSSDGKTFNVWTSDEGTTGNPNLKYYRQQVVLDENGVKTSGDMAAITKEQFKRFCRDIFEPPYAWYTSRPPENTGHPARPISK